jgi:hypothetical protein
LWATKRAATTAACWLALKSALIGKLITRFAARDEWGVQSAQHKFAYTGCSFNGTG